MGEVEKIEVVEIEGEVVETAPKEKRQRTKGGLLVFHNERILLERGKHKGKSLKDLCEDRRIERHTFGKGLNGRNVSPVKAVEMLEALGIPEDKWLDYCGRAGNDTA
ncbi:MAG: hypothetical protein JW984_15070 [Deltaproteobacteria bacterium]|uniref:Uncharacterized protein n=1 Tax=Candidatus Zymogenus saltonus TaxID=2844893 RepID=A0A9D8PP14_9DELT|nr:hypothetical protein [Candidatus Zymogenus saltonus]